MKSFVKIPKQECFVQRNLCNQNFFQVLLYHVNQIEIQSRTDSTLKNRWSKTWADDKRRFWTITSSNQKICKKWRNQNSWWIDDWNPTRNLTSSFWNCKIDVQRFSFNQSSVSCTCKVKQIRISIFFWKITEKSVSIWINIESEIQDNWYWKHICLFMTKRKVKDYDERFDMNQIQTICEENAERLNDSRMKKSLSSSRKTFIRNALRIFMIITTSNNTAYASQRPKNHASLLSHEWFTITWTIRFNKCIKILFNNISLNQKKSKLNDFWWNFYV